jgi:hypothetical protein
MERRKLAPLKRRDRSEKTEINGNLNKNVQENNNDERDNNANIPISGPLSQIPGPIFQIPEFLRKADNEQYLQLFIRMRQRHNADGAVSLNVEADDIADQNLELYDNKGINIEPPHIHESMVKQTEYFIESSNRDKYYKISKETQIIENKTREIKEKPMKKVEEIALQSGKKEKLSTEDEVFMQFDDKLTEIIIKTSSKVSLIFLFAQGLLAGI